MDPTQVIGLPPGSTVSPIAPPPTAGIPGLPPGSTVTPLTPPPAAPPIEKGTTTQADIESQYQQMPKDFDQSFMTQGAQTLKTLGKVLHPMSGGSALDVLPGGAKQAIEKQAAQPTPDSIAGFSGGAVENVLEWMGGDELLKGASWSEKLAKLAPVAKVLEKFPRLAEALNVGIKASPEAETVGSAAAKGAATAGAGTGVQALAHGATPEDAAKAAGIGAAGGALFGGGAQAGIKAITHIAPTVEDIGGQEITRLASQKPYATPAQAMAATAEHNPAVQQAQQGAGKKIIANAAKGAAEQHLGELNEGRTVEPGTRVATPPEGPQNLRDNPQDLAAFTGEKNPHYSPYQERPTFSPVEISQKVANVGSFGDAADVLEDGAKEVYDRLDDVTGGRFTDLREENKRAWNAVTNGGGDAAQARLADSQQKLNALLDGSDAQVGDSVKPADLAYANEAYKKAQVLRDVHSKIEGSFDTSIGSSDRSNAYRGFNGNRLRQNLKALTDSYGDRPLGRIIGRDQLDNLTRLADITRTNADRAKFGGGVNHVAQWIIRNEGKIASGVAGVGGTAGYAVGGHAGAAVGAAGAEATYAAARRVMRAIATDPKIGTQMVTAIKYGARPAMYAPMIGAMIRDAQRQQAAPPPPEEGATSGETKPLTMLGDEADDGAPANNTGVDASATPQAQADAAIANTPAPVQQAYHNVAPTVVAGQALTGRGGNAADASVDQGAGNNTIEINDASSFQRHPASTTAHELVHTWQNNLPPTVQAKIPDDPQDMSAFDISDADKLRSQGHTLATIPREKAATIIQKYIEDPKKNKNLKPWVDDLASTPLSSTLPTAPNATKLNMRPRAPSVPGADVAGMEALYTPRKKK